LFVCAFGGNYCIHFSAGAMVRQLWKSTKLMSRFGSTVYGTFRSTYSRLPLPELESDDHVVCAAHTLQLIVSAVFDNPRLSAGTQSLLLKIFFVRVRSVRRGLMLVRPLSISLLRVVRV
jgi:hypothetical protein